jgi:sugar phosphate isomerase/epimerase
LINRRSLLRAAGLSPGIALGLAAAAPPPAALRLGLVTYNWASDWDLPTLIDRCHRTGFTGVELRTTHRHGVELELDARAREEVRRRFADSPVTLVGLGTTCEYHAPDPAVVRKNIEETKAWIRLCRDLGASGVKVRPNAMPPGVPRERTIEQIGRSLNEVARDAAELGVQIRLEVHGRGTGDVPTCKAIMEIADHPANVICWNCNPSDLEGAGFEANFDLLEDRMGTVHIHDLRRDGYPWPALFRRLRSCGTASFTGWTLLEDAAAPNDIEAAMVRNREIWEQLATRNP